MARHDLHDEFITMQQRIALGDRALIAIAAHVEVRSVLRDAQELRTHGLDDVLVGSYARKVSIWPGKDVDVFGPLMNETTRSITPDAAYEMFGRALSPFEAQGRLTRQPRSFNVAFSPERTPAARFVRAAADQYEWAPTRVDRVLQNLKALAFAFSVDVVPAVKWDEHYGIPEIGRQTSTNERHRTGHWRKTNPVQLTAQTQLRNRSPSIAGAGAYVRTVKAVKQIKAHHLPDTKPSSLFYEFILYEGFEEGAIGGGSWADVTASALSYIADRLGTIGARPVCDPVLHEPYAPAPSLTDLATANSLFAQEALRARRAASADNYCQAAIHWRSVFGGNGQHEHVFPLPVGCRGTGVVMGAAAANLASGGTAEKSFGAP